MNRKNIASILSVSLGLGLGLAGSIVPARADNNKADVVQLIRQEDGKLASLAVDKYITLNLSPEWWQYFLKKDTNAYHELRILADALMTFGNNMGGDNIPSLDTTNDASSPLVTDALNKLAPKAHITINFLTNVPEKFQQAAMHNLDLVANPITDKTYCNPRGHKLNLTITLDPKAKALGSTVSRDGNDYVLTLPAYVDISTSPVEEALKKGT